MPLHYHQFVFGDAFLGDVPSLPGAAQSDALPLPDGVEGEADVLADGLSVGRLDRTRNLRQVAVEKIAEGPLADEADASRVLFRVIGQARVERELAHVRLF